MKLAIGTVQFGLPYGISNKEGQTPLKKVKEILKIAQQNKIQLLDTATLYGQSEEILGKSLNKNHSFKIITKTPYFNVPQITKSEINKLITSIGNSFKKLNQNKIYGVLFHNTNDIFSKNGELLLNELIKLKKQNFIEKIGFSIYEPNQIDKLLKNFNFDLIQLPINILDQKLLLNGSLKKLKKSNIEIHARSIFLQGLLLMPLKDVPDYFNPIKPLLSSYHDALKKQNITLLQAALTFVKKIKYIDYILMGINNKKQLLENIKAYNSDLPEIEFRKYNCNNKTMINPIAWKIKK